MNQYTLGIDAELWVIYFWSYLEVAPTRHPEFRRQFTAMAEYQAGVHEALTTVKEQCTSERQYQPDNMARYKAFGVVRSH